MNAKCYFMNHYLFLFINKIGLDKSIAYSSGSRILAGIAGIVSVFFISKYLSGEEQGFYFTFGSIVALQVFFELGLTGIMTQYVAHEVSHLTLNDDSFYIGEEQYISRLASLIRFCVRWYLVLAVIVFLFLIIVGFLFFRNYGDTNSNVIWEFPWLLVCIGSAAKIFQSPFNSIYMGLGKVKEMSKVGFYQQIILPISLWLGLCFGWKLYIVGISYILSVLFWIVYVWYSRLYLIVLNLLNVKIKEKVSYITEIFPYQWKIALSWVSGYFIFQLFNPVLFATEGPVVAGQMGMTLQALNAIQAISFSWLNTKVPLYSSLIALKDYLTLDSTFNKMLKQMLVVSVFLLISFFLLVVGLRITEIKIGDGILADRFLPLLPLFILSISVYLQQYTNSWATYLRCHKKEPFLINSVCAAVAYGVSTLVFGNLYGLYGIVVSYIIIKFLFFPWGYWIFKTKKREWHEL